MTRGRSRLIQSAAALRLAVMLANPATCTGGQKDADFGGRSNDPSAQVVLLDMIQSSRSAAETGFDR